MLRRKGAFPSGKEHQKELRKLLKGYEKDLESLDKFIKYEEDGTSFTEYLKVEAFSAADLDEELTDWYVSNQIYSEYDCTGQWFISGIKFAHMKGTIYLVQVRWNRDV